LAKVFAGGIKEKEDFLGNSKRNIFPGRGKKEKKGWEEGRVGKTSRNRDDKGGGGTRRGKKKRPNCVVNIDRRKGEKEKAGELEGGQSNINWGTEDETQIKRKNTNQTKYWECRKIV